MSTRIYLLVVVGFIGGSSFCMQSEHAGASSKEAVAAVGPAAPHAYRIITVKFDGKLIRLYVAGRRVAQAHEFKVGSVDLLASPTKKDIAVSAHYSDDEHSMHKGLSLSSVCDSAKGYDCDSSSSDDDSETHDWDSYREYCMNHAQEYDQVEKPQ